MQLSDSTLDILRNFSAINQNILIKADSPIKTISEARNVVARADIPEKFLKDFGIYDLNEFIGVTGLVNSPSLHFNDDFVMISDESGRSSVKYFYSAAETLTTPTIGQIQGGGNNTSGHTVPNLADDTFALLAASQTFTNKVIDSGTY